MEIASTSVFLKDGHHHLPLPFCNEDRVMPDNCDMAEQRTLNLLKKFKRDAGYAAEYKNLMVMCSKKSYAEKVPPEQLHRRESTLPRCLPSTKGQTQSRVRLHLIIQRYISQQGTLPRSWPNKHSLWSSAPIPPRANCFHGRHWSNVLPSTCPWLSQGLPQISVVAWWRH